MTFFMPPFPNKSGQDLNPSQEEDMEERKDQLQFQDNHFKVFNNYLRAHQRSSLMEMESSYNFQDTSIDENEPEKQAERGEEEVYLIHYSPKKYNLDQMQIKNQNLTQLPQDPPRSDLKEISLIQLTSPQRLSLESRRSLENLKDEQRDCMNYQLQFRGKPSFLEDLEFVVELLEKIWEGRALCFRFNLRALPSELVLEDQGQDLLYFLTTASGEVIGGYQSHSFRKGELSQSDWNSFLFNFSLKVILDVSYGEQVISRAGPSLLSFGNDLRLSPNPLEADSFSQFPSHYNNPQVKAKDVFPKIFRLKKIEVYRVEPMK